MHNPCFITVARPHDIIAELTHTTSPAGAFERVRFKENTHVVRIRELEIESALLLKQILLPLDAHILMSPVTSQNTPNAKTDVFIFASFWQMQELITCCHRASRPALQRLAVELHATLSSYDLSGRDSLTLRGHTFIWGVRTYVVTTLDLTPYPFNENGGTAIHDLVATALAQARHAAHAGADLIEICCEPVHPGDPALPPAQEQSSIVPIIETLIRHLSLPIAINSSRTATVAAALAAGADMVHAPRGLRTPDGAWNTPLADLVATHGVPLALIYGGAAAGEHLDAAGTDNAIFDSIIGELQSSIAYAQAHNIDRAQLLVDPGIGPVNRLPRNRALLRQLNELRGLGLPIMVNIAYESFMEESPTLRSNHDQARTATTTTLAIQYGADLVRTSHVEGAIQAARIADTVVRPA
mgnify:CR=1 FL=1